MRNKLNWSGKVSVAAFSFCLIIGNCQIGWSAPVADKDPHATGLKPFTPEQEIQFKKEHLHIKNVRPNKMSLERVNKERAGKHLSALDSSLTAPEGADIEAAPLSATTTSTISGSATLSAIPTGVDNSKNPWFPPVRSQGSIGSCVAWALTYYQMTYMNAMAKNITVNNGDNTQIFSPKWTYNMINFGQDGGAYFSDAFNLEATSGAAKWSEFPYDSNYLAWDLNSADWVNAIYNRMNPVTYVTSASSSTGLSQIKQLLANGYIVTYGTYINSWQYTNLKNDPATPDDDAYAGQPVAFWMNGTNGGHGMTIVGYNDAVWTDINGNGVVDPGEKGAFKIVNSWGTGWGMSGFMWLAYDALASTSNVSGGPNTGRVGAFQSDMVFIITAKTNYSPKVIAQFTVNHLQRNQMGLSLGISSNSVTSPSSSWYPSGLSSDGGAWAFNGTTSAVNGTFALDYTDLLGGTSPQRFYLGITDNASGNPTSLVSWSLIDLTNNTTTPATNMPLSVDAKTLYPYIDYGYFNGNYPPTASVAATPTSGMVPLTVSFNGSGSSDSDGTISSYNWNFGDGYSASGMTVNHTYQNSGNFTATLTVTDNGGATGSATGTISVTADPNQINAPGGLTLSSKLRAITLKWVDNSSNEEGFYIEQSLKSGSRLNYSRVGQVGPNVTTLTVNVSSSGTYYYRVQAFNLTTGRVSNYSNAVSIRIR